MFEFKNMSFYWNRDETRHCVVALCTFTYIVTRLMFDVLCSNKMTKINIENLQLWTFSAQRPRNLRITFTTED